jgi:hypothetical protein
LASGGGATVSALVSALTTSNTAFLNQTNAFIGALVRLSQIAQSIALENQVFASFTDQRRLRWISQRERTIERGLRHLLSN